MRVASVQIDYLPAYYRSGIDFLAFPLEKSFDTGGTKTNDLVRQWRNELHAQYVHVFDRKLEAICSHAHGVGTNLLVFPEYSVPPECLVTLSEFSSRTGMAILAGSHRVEEYPLRSPEASKIMRHPTPGGAISPLLLNGEATNIIKYRGSAYDTEIERPDLEPKPQVVPVADFNIEFCI